MGAMMKVKIKTMIEIMMKRMIVIQAMMRTTIAMTITLMR